MCTLIVLNEVIPDYPLVIAANRDERYNRKSGPPEVRILPDLSLIMPKDEERGGTWLGVAQNGWFAGITNQDDGHHDPTKASRGKVVQEVLEAGTHSMAARILAGLDPDHYNPFNLVFGRPGAMFLTRILSGQNIEMEPLSQGINIISNDCWGNAYANKELRARELAGLASDWSDDITVLQRNLIKALSDHSATDDPFQALCVHAEEYAFGTVSSSVITVSNQGVAEYWYKDGHACQLSELKLAGRLLHLDLTDI